MRHFTRIGAFLLLSALCGGSGLPASAEDALTRELSPQELALIARNREAYLQQRLQILYAIDPSGEVDRADVETYDRIRRARQRAQGLIRTLVWDLDGDGAITPAERSEAAGQVEVRDRVQFEMQMLEADANNDGILAFDEIVAAIDEKIPALKDSGDNASTLFAFDIDGDGVVTQKEIVDRVNEIADNPPDSRSAAPASAGSKSADNRCEFPTVPPEAELVFLSGRGGAMVSNIAVGGLESTSSLARLVVEEGEKPLFVIASSFDPVVWSFEGATDRVIGFFARPGQQGNPPGIGVVGLDREKVSFLSDLRCMNYITSSTDGKARIAVAKLATETRHNVDHVIVGPRVGDVHIPSGEKVETARDRVAALRKHLDEVYPPQSTVLPGPEAREIYEQIKRAMVEMEDEKWPKVDVGAVVAPGPVAEYAVLPGKAGLEQLVKSGAVTLTSDDYYIVEKDIPGFPAGLHGSDAVRFIIAKGVKMPAGDPGHSKVFVEDMASCPQGQSCTMR